MEHFFKTGTLAFALLWGMAAQAQDDNPYKSIGKKAKVQTLSRGKYVESFDTDSIQRIGSVMINLRTKEIVALLDADSLMHKASDNSSASRWYSIDPKADEFSSQSPYVAMDNNPILKNDPTGMSGEVTIDKQNKTIIVTSNITFYGSVGSADLAKQTAADIQNAWNAAAGKVSIGGVDYSVQFSVSGTYDANLSASAITSNTGIKNNYIKLMDSGIPVSSMDGSSATDPSSNTGRFLMSNITGPNTTTEAHEFGHGWGAVAGTADGHPTDTDLRGKGQPGIMHARGTAVDAPYTYDPTKGATTEDPVTGARSNTMDPNTRKVTQNDINYLNIGSLKFDANGKAQLGRLTNIAH